MIREWWTVAGDGLYGETVEDRTRNLMLVVVVSGGREATGDDNSKLRACLAKLI
ncbi:hypothetical protein HanRHA438_Chr10g0470191 [Helianthus annuus]|nr:hypothetical protein HanRHA438_Chr10g0470191 [Helianthus annuus]